MNKLNKRIEVRVETLGFLVKDGLVWLAAKTRKKGIGMLNGYGGGTHRGESLIQCLAREIRVETGGVEINPSVTEEVARAEFVNYLEDGSKLLCLVHVFIVSEWKGDPVSTAEMVDPQQYPISHLPTDRMFPSDAQWVPRVLAGERLRVYATHTPGQRGLIGQVSIEPVSSDSVDED